MNYQSTAEIQSALYPGVSYRLRKMSKARQIKFNEGMASYLEKQRILNDELALLREEYQQLVSEVKLLPCTCEHSEHDEETKACKTTGCKCREIVFPPEKWAKLVKLSLEEKNLLELEMQPALLRWGVDSIAGLNIDGEPSTVDTLIGAGPPDLCQEISTEITRLLGLSADEKKIEPPPSTLNGQADGTTTSTVVPSASGTKVIEEEDVFAIAI